MSTAPGIAVPRGLASTVLQLPLWLPAAGIAILVGLFLGYRDPFITQLLGAVFGAGVLLAAATAPLSGYLVLIGSSIMLVVISLNGGRGLNVFDVLLVPLLLTTTFGGAAARARAEDRALVGEPHVLISAATRRFTDAVWVYVAVAAASLLLLTRTGQPDAAVSSGLILVRAVQGMMIFPLGLVLMRSERDFTKAVRALVVGGALFAVINALSLLSGSKARAGMTWWANEPLWSVGDPIEAGSAMLLIWVLVLAQQATSPRRSRWLLLPGIFTLLVLTQTRSALLAWIVFTLLTLRRGHWRYVAITAALSVLAIPLLPDAWWSRMSRTLVLERGSFEAFSALVRVYGWHAAVRVFFDHPLFGVGYLGFRFVSARYNDLGVALGTCENMFLEIATGMGIVGLIAFWRVLRALFGLGATVRRHAPQGSFAWHLAGFHAPYMLALLVANLTGDNWVGLVGLAQLGLWCALLVRAGHLSLRDATGS
jgi:hypothetical protein